MMQTEKARPMGRCWCGCGEATPIGRFFVSSHDRNAAIYLRDLGIERERIADLILRSGFNPETRRLKEAWRNRK